jgi:hypothetical protein
MIDKEQRKQFEYLKVFATTWGSVILTIVTLIVTICCSCFCKCCRKCAFWVWDKWTPRECVSHTKERCCVITNINAERVTYHEVPQTPALTPASSHSLPVAIREPSQSRLRDSTPRRRSPSRVTENWELVEFQMNPRMERKGER